MSYLELLPQELLIEVTKYLRSPYDLINFETIKGVELIYKNPWFWYNKFLAEFPELNVKYFNVLDWDSPYDYKRLFESINDIKDSLQHAEKYSENGRFLVYQNLDNIPILEVPDKLTSLEDADKEYNYIYEISYIQYEKKYYEKFWQFVGRSTHNYITKEITKNEAINMMAYLTHNYVKLQSR